MKSIFYDLSSSTFTGSRCVLMKWGHCKEGFHNHVVLALVVNQQGLPFYWEVLPGGTADAKTITWLLSRLESRSKVSQTTLVFDRGMVSDDNLALLEEAKLKYISAMDRSQLEGVTGLDFNSFSYLSSEDIDEQTAKLPGFTKLNSDTYYREIRCEGGRRYILCFNPQLFREQRKMRSQSVEDFRTFVIDLNEELAAAKRSRQRKATYDKFERQLQKKRLQGFVDVELHLRHVLQIDCGDSEDKIRTYRGTVHVDSDKMLQAGKLDGFWLLVTNHTEKEEDRFRVSSQEAIRPYREKVVIESAFRDLKSFIEIAPVFVWKAEHVKAHYTVCVLSHLKDRTLTLRLHEKPGDRTREVVSHERLYKTLSDCKLNRIEIRNVVLSTCSMTKATEEQKELLCRVGLQHLLSEAALDKAKSHNFLNYV